MIHFAFDNPSKPNLVFQDRDHDSSWPRTVPCRLLMYLDRASIKHTAIDINHAPWRAWYPIGLGWFDHELDYFDLMPENTRQKLSRGAIRVLFYYHEGDDPTKIKQRLDHLVQHHSLPESCYVFISANSRARDLENFVYFADHEFFFRHVNRGQNTLEFLSGDRGYKFTALNRIHKWWRASAMADLHRHGVLENSLWSYNTVGDEIGAELDNPLQLDSDPNWRSAVDRFLTLTPHHCDDLDHHDHNKHGNVNIDLYQKSYCHIVFETHFDADQSGGTFLTEKTFKPIKFAQPFVLAGPQGSLEELRRMGYRVFDGIIDNSYDTISDNTQRWVSLRRAILDIDQSVSAAWMEQCRSDIEHNLQMFMARCWDPLNSLIKEIQCR